MNELMMAFREYFEVLPADTPELLDEVFRLRYQVYCEEGLIPGFEPWRFPKHLETDEYDARAVHYLMRHRPSRQWVGSLRLVLCDADDPQKPFPVERLMGGCIDPALIDTASLPRQQTAEVSRLVIAKNFRCRRGENRHTFGGVNAPKPGNDLDQRHFPHPVVGLLVALTHMSAHHRITHWYAIMEPILNRLLRRFSFNLTPIGPVTDCHGLRRPYHEVVNDLLGRVYERQRPLWELVTDQGNIYPASRRF